MSIIIKTNIENLMISQYSSIKEALLKIELNEDGVVFCIDDQGILMGILTDGDFRRHVIKNPNLDLLLPVAKVMNGSFVTANYGEPQFRIEALMGEGIKFIPLINKFGRLVAIARRRNHEFKIGVHHIGVNWPCFIIAEIGNNHNGDFDNAKRLVDLAIEVGANCAKFQMRDLSSLYLNQGSPNDHREDLGSQYTIDLLSRYQLPRDEMFKIFDYCKNVGITPLCTPWDFESVRALEEYGISGYKSASADLTNHDLLLKIAQTGKPMICSTGMSTEQEILESIQILNAHGAQYALLHCNSTYPAPFKDLNLSYIDALRRMGTCPVGYSSHERGINIAVAAVARGANIIEKHFTYDRELEGNDHKVSLLPEEFSEMVKAIRQVEEAIGRDDVRKISQGELMNRETLGKSLVMKNDLAIGEIIESHMLEVRSPGKGLQPNRRKDIVGKKATRDLVVGDILYVSDLYGGISKARNFNFKRPFGIPVRYHDIKLLSNRSNFDLLEFHLSYQDLEENEESFFEAPLDLDYVVHAPELFKNDHVLDLCSLNPGYRDASIKNLEKVIEVTKRLRKFFLKSKRPRIVVNMGGFTQDEPMAIAERNSRYDLIADSLSRLDLSAVEIIPQTMPPFPWHFGGQRFQNLFIDADEIVKFCKSYNLNICLDISHSKLACNHFDWNLSKYLKTVGPYISHMHLADAEGVDGEGLQIGQGDIDFSAVGLLLNAVAPDASFIPEIWQGHKDGGREFWEAFDILESYTCY